MTISWRALLQLILGLGIATLFLYMMGPFIVPMVLGAVIAILCYPLYVRAARKVPKGLAALGITLGIVIGILLPLSLVIYSTAYKVLGLISRISIPATGPASAEEIMNHPWMKKITLTVEGFVAVDKEWLRDQALSLVHGILEKTSGLLAGSLAGMPGFVLGFAIVMISIYFFLVDGDRFLRFLSEISPLSVEKSRELFQTFQNSCRGVVLGLLLSGLVQGILMMFFFVVTGIPDPLLMGVITMIFAMVPLFGSTPIGIGAIIYLFAKGHAVMAIVMIVGAIIIGLSDNVIRSMTMRGASEMHPLLALVSVFGAVQLFGATGIFLGPIIAAVFMAFVKMASIELRREFLNSSGITLSDLTNP